MANEAFKQVVELIVPEYCYDELFVKLNFFHVACLKIALSKCLGYSIILGSVMVKIPQILKIMSAKSAEGISLVSTGLEMSCITASLAYGLANKFPFSAYGEAIFLSIQTYIIYLLTLWYTNRHKEAVIHTTIYVGLLAFLLSPAAPMKLLVFLQAMIMPTVVFSRFIQVLSNYQEGHTGQLSIITWFLLFAGSIGRIFTSVQETGDTVLILTYMTSTICNGIITAQIFYYWNATKLALSKKKE